nr:hypothetical protein [Tanacetum cinerariifolium]
MAATSGPIRHQYDPEDHELISALNYKLQNKPIPFDQAIDRDLYSNSPSTLLRSIQPIGIWKQVLNFECLCEDDGKALGIATRFVFFEGDVDIANVRKTDWSMKELTTLNDDDEDDSERGIKCIFVGYAKHLKAFRFYVIEPNDSVSINSIIDSRDAIFDENRFSSVPRPSQKSLVKGIEDSGGLVVPEKVTKEKEAINDEMDSIMGNNTWVLAGLPLGIDYFDTYALVVRISTIRLMIAMTSIHNLIIHLIDVKTAFLNGDLNEEVDMTKEFLSSRFSMKDIGESDVILGIRIKHKSNGIEISQSHYIEKVVSQLKYSRVICYLMYAMTCTRPDIAFPIGKLSSAGKESEWLKNLLFEIPLWSKPIAPISIRCDSPATLAKAYSQMYNEKSRDLDVKHSMIHDGKPSSPHKVIDAGSNILVSDPVFLMWSEITRRVLGRKAGIWKQVSIYEYSCDNIGDAIGKVMSFVFFERDVDVGVFSKTHWCITEFITMNEDEAEFSICKVRDAVHALDDSSSEENDVLFGITNEVDTASIQVSAISAPVSTVSSHDNTANLSDALSISFVEHENKKVLPENCPRNQESRPRNQDSSRKTVIVEDTSFKAMVAIDGAGLFAPPSIDFSNSGLEEFQHPKFEGYGPKDRCFTRCLKDQGYFDSGCSRHMTGNISYLTDFKEHDGGYVAFGGGAKGGKITGKDTIRTATKDESSRILKSFVTKIENLVEKKVKIIRCDNGIEFKNRVINEFCEEKGIKREYSMARTPQQNRVAERRNRTLIEVLVVKPYFKTPYELFKGRSPALSFMRPFGCYVFILNTLDQLRKFDGKLNEEIFVGYSTTSKAFSVYNIKTKKVEENLHITFLENKPMITGGRPKWLFDIDALSKLMNYAPVSAGTNSNDFVVKGASFDAGQSSMETGSSQYYILMPLWKDNSLFDSFSQASDSHNKNKHGPSQASKSDNHERLNTESSTKTVNIAGPVNTATPTYVDYPNDHLMPDLEDCGIFDDAYDDRDEDVKSAFLYGTIEEEVYVSQPLGFVDLEFPDRVYKTKIHMDNESVICVVKNPVYHSKTKHIEIRHHFIRDFYKKRLIEMVKIHTEYNVTDLLTKAFDVTRFQFLIAIIGLELKGYLINDGYDDLVQHAGDYFNTAGVFLLGFYQHNK